MSYPVHYLLRFKLLLLAAIILVLTTGCSTRTIVVPPEKSHHLWHDRKLRVTDTESEIFQVTNFRFIPDALEGDFIPWEQRRQNITPIRRTLLLDDISSMELMRPPDTQQFIPLVAIAVAAALVPFFQEGFRLVEIHEKVESCPYLYVSANSGWVWLAEIFSGAVAPSLKAEDWVAIPSWGYGNGPSRALITNELQELDFIDQLVWATAKHAPDTRVIRDISGNFWEVGKATPLPEDNILGGGGILQRRLDFEIPNTLAEELVLEITLRNTWQSVAVFSDLVSLTEPNQAHWASSLERESTHLEHIKEIFRRGALTVLLRKEDRWIEVGRIPVVGPKLPRTVAIYIPQYQNEDKQVRVRLEWHYGIWLMYSINVAPVYGPTNAIELLPLSSASISGSDSMLELLSTVDGRYAILAPGDTLNITVPSEEMVSPEITSLFLVANGYYTHASHQSRWSVLGRIIRNSLIDPLARMGYGIGVLWFFAPGLVPN